MNGLYLNLQLLLFFRKVPNNCELDVMQQLQIFKPDATGHFQFCYTVCVPYC
jgi:hypothetical protein